MVLSLSVLKQHRTETAAANDVNIVCAVTKIFRAKGENLKQ